MTEVQIKPVLGYAHSFRCRTHQFCRVAGQRMAKLSSAVARAVTFHSTSDANLHPFQKKAPREERGLRREPGDQILSSL